MSADTDINPQLLLDNVRQVLVIQEETIIFALIPNNTSHRKGDEVLEGQLITTSSLMFDFFNFLPIHMVAFIFSCRDP